LSLSNRSVTSSAVEHTKERKAKLAALEQENYFQEKEESLERARLMSDHASRKLQIEKDMATAKAELAVYEEDIENSDPEIVKQTAAKPDPFYPVTLLNGGMQFFPSNVMFSSGDPTLHQPSFPAPLVNQAGMWIHRQQLFQTSAIYRNRVALCSYQKNSKMLINIQTLAQGSRAWSCGQRR
jgi:hypothetical protein